jgi:hypothetical protein
MNLWNLIVAVLWTAWEHLIIPVLDPIAPLIFSVLMGYFLIRTRAKREAEIQKLKTQLDTLRQRLDFIQATTVTVTIELNGPGPFQMPLLTHVNWIGHKREDGIIAGFRSEDGKRIFTEISYRAVAQLLNDQRSMPLEKTLFLTSTSIDLAKPADVYELPALPRFEGHLQRGRDLWILVFSSEPGQKFCFQFHPRHTKTFYENLKPRWHPVSKTNEATEILIAGSPTELDCKRKSAPRLGMRIYNAGRGATSTREAKVKRRLTRFEREPYDLNARIF